MSTSHTTKDCDIFTRARKSTVKNKKETSSLQQAGASNMADIADVLKELKSLRSEFGLKLDGINNSLGDMTNAIAALEGKVAEVKQDVSEHAKCIEEAENRVMMAEEELESVRAELASTVKRLTYVEMKTDDLENRSSRNNLRMFGLKEGAEGTQPLLDFIREMLPK